MSQIKVTVDPMGQMVVETEGYTGKECTEATKQLERALGKVTKDEKKPEYHRQAKRQLRGQA